MRPHQSGDAARAIDWYASAHRGNLCVRERARDEALTWAAIIDDSGSMRVPEADPPAAAAREAVNSWRDCLVAGDTWMQIDCAAFSVEDTLHAALCELPSGCALLCVSDFYDATNAARPSIAAAARRFDCTALLVRDRWNSPAGMLRVTDAENAVTRKLYFGRRELARYARAARERENAVRDLFRGCGWRAALLDRDPGQALLNAFDPP